ncbi:MAG: TIGR04282 family arsenosugar biosynthesis glycosyltransferase [Armatimonadota bacterium]
MSNDSRSQRSPGCAENTAPRQAVIVFARSPAPGRTKTRLIPALGPERAAELYRCFLLDTLDAVRGLPADVILAAADVQDVAALSDALDAYSLTSELVVQSGADLGDRITRAAADVLSAGYTAVIVIGTDAPDLPCHLLVQALDLISSHDVVLGPSLDGGYYLIGLRAAEPALFHGVAWSSQTTLSDTIERARGLGLTVALLEPWRDVDTPEDLSALRERLAARTAIGDQVHCRRTWGLLCGTGADSE